MGHATTIGPVVGIAKDFVAAKSGGERIACERVTVRASSRSTAIGRLLAPFAHHAAGEELARLGGTLPRRYLRRPFIQTSA